jgi:hypothetical protein
MPAGPKSSNLLLLRAARHPWRVLFPDNATGLRSRQSHHLVETALLKIGIFIGCAFVDEEDPWTRIGGRVAAADVLAGRSTIGRAFCKEEGSLILFAAEGAQKSHRGSQQS